METIKKKTYMFHYDLFFLPSDPDDWYGDYPVELTDDEFEELVQAIKIWTQPEIRNSVSDLDGDDSFMYRYCPTKRRITYDKARELNRIRLDMKITVTRHYDIESGNI